MRGVLDPELGSALYRQRGQLIEPIFGHTKHNPRLHTLSPARKIRGTDRMAAHGRHPQPRQAPQPTSTGPATDARPRAAGRPTLIRHDLAGVYATASRERSSGLRAVRPTLAAA